MCIAITRLILHASEIRGIPPTRVMEGYVQNFALQISRIVGILFKYRYMLQLKLIIYNASFNSRSSYCNVAWEIKTCANIG